MWPRPMSSARAVGGSHIGDFRQGCLSLGGRVCTTVLKPGKAWPAVGWLNVLAFSSARKHREGIFKHNLPSHLSPTSSSTDHPPRQNAVPLRPGQVPLRDGVGDVSLYGADRIEKSSQEAKPLSIRGSRVLAERRGLIGRAR
jgi:hypothetical protein